MLEEDLVCMVEDGYLRVPDPPGLGIDVRMDFVERYLDWSQS
jgi:L-alanine-DL-glutamate epimerase-like enolase superfamily enzyme